MKISLLEPIGIDAALMDELSAPLKEKGHEFVFYPEKLLTPMSSMKEQRTATSL